MKKNKNLIDNDLEKRFEKLEKQHPKPEKINKRTIILKIIVSLIAIILIGMIIIPLIINN